MLLSTGLNEYNIHFIAIFPDMLGTHVGANSNHLHLMVLVSEVRFQHLMYIYISTVTRNLEIRKCVLFPGLGVLALSDILARLFTTRTLHELHDTRKLA